MVDVLPSVIIALQLDIKLDKLVKTILLKHVCITLAVAWRLQRKILGFTAAMSLLWQGIEPDMSPEGRV